MGRLFLFLSIIFLSGYGLFAQDTVKVIRVVDACTIEIELEGQIQTIRLLGVNPTKANPEYLKGKSSKFIDGVKKREKEAFNFTKSLIKKGDNVLIDFDKSRFDRMNRLVGYVYFNNGKMLNEQIIESGYASVSFEAPNTKFQERFQKDYLDARENRRGLWK